MLVARNAAKLNAMRDDFPRRYGCDVLVVPADLSEPGAGQRV